MVHGRTIPLAIRHAALAGAVVSLALHAALAGTAYFCGDVAGSADRMAQRRAPETLVVVHLVPPPSPPEAPAAPVALPAVQTPPVEELEPEPEPVAAPPIPPLRVPPPVARVPVQDVQSVPPVAVRVVAMESEDLRVLDQAQPLPPPDPQPPVALAAPVPIPPPVERRPVASGRRVPGAVKVFMPAPGVPPVEDPSEADAGAIRPPPVRPFEVDPSGAAPREAAPPPVAAGPSGPTHAARPLVKPDPAYPRLSARRGEQGIVELDVEILADGRVGRITVVRAPGFPRLVEAAIAAIKAACFEPARQQGTPVDSLLRVPVHFVLR